MLLIEFRAALLYGTCSSLNLATLCDTVLATRTLPLGLRPLLQYFQMKAMIGRNVTCMLQLYTCSEVQSVCQLSIEVLQSTSLHWQQEFLANMIFHSPVESRLC